MERVVDPTPAGPIPADVLTAMGGKDYRNRLY